MDFSHTTPFCLLSAPPSSTHLSPCVLANPRPDPHGFFFLAKELPQRTLRSSPFSLAFSPSLPRLALKFHPPSRKRPLSMNMEPVSSIVVSFHLCIRGSDRDEDPLRLPHSRVATDPIEPTVLLRFSLPDSKRTNLGRCTSDLDF